MTETVDSTAMLLRETAARVFADHTEARMLAAAEDGSWPKAAWDAVAEAGLHRALVPEAAGGYGVSVPAALSILQVAGEYALPLPLAETMLAGWLLGRAGLDIPDGPLTIAPVIPGDHLVLSREAASWRLTGEAARVPWGRHAAGVVVIAEHGGTNHVVLVAPDAWSVSPGENVAREPRDMLRFSGAVAAIAPLPVTRDDLRLAGAAARTQQIAGGMIRLTAMTTQYALDRTQFGRPIGKFQAIQQSMAVLAGQTAAAAAAAGLAAEAVGEVMNLLPIAAGKARAGEAASIGAGIAHQVHGAIGFTFEHSLHFTTKRLWSWRDEFGNDSSWNKAVGRHMARIGGYGVWAAITAA
jgi:alkylation response protein AidB-like acyl-CoA dehydrogenase